MGQTHSHTDLSGADLTEIGQGLARLNRNHAPRVSSPAGQAVIPRGSRNTVHMVLRDAAGPKGLRRRDVPVWTIAIEAAMGAGSKSKEI